METNIKALRIKLQGIFQSKYGYQIDDWTTIIINEFQENFNAQNKILKEGFDEIKKARNEIRGQIKSIRFNNKDEAFWYALGKYVPITLLIALILLSSLGFYKLYSENDPYDVFFKNGNIETIKNYEFIRLKIAKNKNLQIGNEYKYDPKTNTILVPIRKNELIQTESNFFDFK